ncbi:MAG: LLM class flavin-dependent oxidoreductase [Gammaproteobacteria bacterium]|nr:LLM class flavin-dependent oxidoreductase [Gammaproteobacteria bacterium]
MCCPAQPRPPLNSSAGSAGQNPNYYQRALREVGQHLQQVEALGFDFVAFSEHHFHSEGLEISNNPVLLGAWAAMPTKRLRIGQMGNVLATPNPLLLAEDLAMLDHFSEGRMMAGFARGYQARHVGTTGQKYNAYWTSPNDLHFAEHDRVNREPFSEHYEILRKAWLQPLFKHVGQRGGRYRRGSSRHHETWTRLHLDALARLVRIQRSAQAPRRDGRDPKHSGSNSRARLFDLRLCGYRSAQT